MKIKILLVSVIFISSLLLLFSTFQSEDSSYNKHLSYLNNSSYLLNNNYLSKKELVSLGLPPNKYFEQQHYLQLNPSTGKTEPENLFALQENLNDFQNRSVPGSNDNTVWSERGPNDVPGRTRAMLYDPNDSTHKRVFAGGVSGGLWVIDDIENSNAVWQRVGIPENLSVSCISVDVNDSNTFYVGTGESYVQGDVNGNGVWKSIDGGNTWSHIFGGSSGDSFVTSDAEIIVDSPTAISGSYVAIQTTNFGPSLTQISGDLVIVDDGSANPTEGCNSLINSSAVNGNIAVIDRANCNFTDKVKNAQLAGAIAVIMVNSVDTFPFNMGGTDSTITIPSVMISKLDGQIIKDALATTNVHVTLNPIETDLPAGFTLKPGKYHVNDIVTRSYNNQTEIYAAISESRFESGGILGGEYGLFKSTDGGLNWQLVNLPLIDNHKYAPNDLMVTSDNKIWVATTNSYSFGDGGGTVFSSDDGVAFTQKYNLPTGSRTEMASSSTNPSLIYLLISTGTDSIELIKTTTAFNFTTTLTKPSDPNVSVTDFTDQQSFYDLAIAVNPHNDSMIVVGGINTFKSSNGGSSWDKTSWSRAYTANISNIHSDVHNFVFHPTDVNKGIIGTDGGVFYVNNWNTAQYSSNAMEGRGNGYNTTQFYKGAIGQNPFNEKLLGGAQDNQTVFINNANSGINSSVTLSGGDGMYCFIDKDSQYMITSLYYNAYYKYDMNGGFLLSVSQNQTEGDFVNTAELDDNLDILFTNAHTGSGSSIDAKITRFSGLNTTNIVREELTNSILTRPVSAMKVSPYTTTSTTLFLGTDIGQIIKVTGAQFRPFWVDLTPEPYVTPFRGSVSSINFGANEDEIMVTFHNYGVVSIYFTEDGGVTWQNKEGDFPDIPVNDILMNPLLNDEVIIATDLGVWKTNNFKDASPHWVRSNNGMQNVKVTSFDYRTLDNTVLASTYGRGLFTGQFTATSTASVGSLDNISKTITVFPTVSDGTFFLKSNIYLNNSVVKVYNQNGKEVHSENVDINKSKSSISLNVEAGVYFVKVYNQKLSETHKIIIR